MPIEAKQYASFTSSQREILTALDELDLTAKKLGHPIIPYCPNSLAGIRELNSSMQAEILDTVTTYNNILKSQIKNHNPNEQMTLAEEIECLDFALNNFDLRTADNDYSFIGPGDIIEVYDATKNTQIYRNLALLEISIYDFLTLLSCEWFVLHERPKLITEQIFAKIQSVMTSDQVGAVPFNIVKHILKAKSDEEVNVANVELKYIKPLFDLNTGNKTAFIATQKGGLSVVRGEDTQKITYIQ